MFVHKAQSNQGQDTAQKENQGQLQQQQGGGQQGEIQQKDRQQRDVKPQEGEQKQGVQQGLQSPGLPAAQPSVKTVHQDVQGSQNQQPIKTHGDQLKQQENNPNKEPQAADSKNVHQPSAQVHNP